MVNEFNINVSNEDIDLLKQKIKLTRWPDEINHKWSHGTDMSYLKQFSDKWLHEFDWRTHEEKINNIGSYSFESSSGLKIHFLHSKSNSKDALPIVMTHGDRKSVV